MKTIGIAIVLGLLLIGLFSCGAERQVPIAKGKSDNNETYTVNYLFEHEGCKVYRFYDRGNYVYFTNCSGDVTSIADDSTSHRVENKIRTIKQP